MLGKAYEDRGHKVIYRKKEDSREMFMDLWSTEGIYMMVFAGHGGEIDGDWYGFHAEPSSDVGYVAPDEVNPPYHLRAIHAFTCGSANPIIDGDPDLLPGGQLSTSSWLDHLSSEGFFHGFWGSVYWGNAVGRTIIIDRGASEN